MKTVYKVVFHCKETGNRLSATYHKSNNLKYSTDETTVPEFGKIFAFETEEDALEFCRENLVLHEIWRAETSKTTKPTPYIPKVGNCYRAWWADNCRQVHNSLYQQATPNGTIWCDDLILIEKVE